MSSKYTYYVPDPTRPGAQYDSSVYRHGPPPHRGGAHPSRPDDRAMGPRSSGVPTKQTRQQMLHGLTPKQVQKLLKSRGYNIKVDGKMGAETASAMDAYIKGKSPNQYNTWASRHFGSPSKGGNLVSNFLHDAINVSKGGGKSGGGGGGNAPGDPFDGLDPTVGNFLPESLAAQLAGLQFDPSINSVQRLLDAMPGQRAQNLHDIEHWYGQVLAEQDKAGKRDTEISKAGVGSVKDAVNSIIASLGGSANQGAGVVGGAGADAVGMLGAEGAAQDEYNSDLRPLLQSESAGARTAESNRLLQMEKDLRGQLSDLMGQRGSARAASLLDIKDKNNALAQAQFANQLSLLQTKQAGAIAAGKAIAAAHKPPKGSYAGSSSTQKLGVMQTAVGAIVDPDTGKLRVDIPRAVQLVNQIVSGAGWDRRNPAVLAFRNSILQSVGITPQAGWN